MVKYRSGRGTKDAAPVRITEKSHAPLDLLARNDLTPDDWLSANARNAASVKYLTALNYDQGYYGAPRTVLGTLSVRY